MSSAKRGLKWKPAILLCPKCAEQRLQPHYLEGIKVDACPVCEGIWFDGDELEEILRRDSRDFEFDDLSRTEIDGKVKGKKKRNVNRKRGHCPRCGEVNILLDARPSPMDPGLRVDRCPQLHGTWLDGGELQRLRNRKWVAFQKRWPRLLRVLKRWLHEDWHRPPPTRKKLYQRPDERS